MISLTCTQRMDKFPGYIIIYYNIILFLKFRKTFLAINNKI